MVSTGLIKTLSLSFESELYCVCVCVWTLENSSSAAVTHLLQLFKLLRKVWWEFVVAFGFVSTCYSGRQSFYSQRKAKEEKQIQIRL